MSGLIEVRELCVWYGESQALDHVALTVNKGEVVTLLGRNGAGKSSTLKAIMGLARAEGSIRLDGVELVAMPSYQIAARGIGFCPEERAIFSSLTVEENLTLPPLVRVSEFSIERIYALFPSLHLRRRSYGGKLSGGEQQMLAIARILRAGHAILLLDEPSEGLAPVVVDTIHDAILALKKQGYTIVLVEQNLDLALSLGDRHYVLESGRVVQQLTAAQVASEYEDLTASLGV